MIKKTFLALTLVALIPTISMADTTCKPQSDSYYQTHLVGTWQVHYKNSDRLIAGNSIYKFSVQFTNDNQYIGKFTNINDPTDSKILNAKWSVKNGKLYEKTDFDESAFKIVCMGSDVYKMQEITLGNNTYTMTRIN